MSPAVKLAWLGDQNRWSEESEAVLNRCRELGHVRRIEADHERHVDREWCEECGYEFKVDTSG